MASLAQRLPVSLIPEQLFISAMRDDVVNHGCRDYLPALEAFHAQWIPAQESFTRCAPFMAISAAVGAFPGIQTAVLFAVHPVRQVRAAGMTAGAFGFSGHDPPHRTKNPR